MFVSIVPSTRMCVILRECLQKVRPVTFPYKNLPEGQKGRGRSKDVARDRLHQRLKNHARYIRKSYTACLEEENHLKKEVNMVKINIILFLKLINYVTGKVPPFGQVW